MDIGIFNKAYLYLNCGKKSVVIQNKYTLSEKIDYKILNLTIPLFYKSLLLFLDKS